MSSLYYIVKKLDDRDSETVERLVREFSLAAAKHGWKEVLHPAGARVIVVVGGDGTMLYGMSLSAKLSVPVFGFNIGKVGYLAEFQPEAIESTLEDIEAGRVNIEQRTLVHEHISGKDAINEFAIIPARSADTLKYEFFVNGVSSGRHHANGLLVSTPTGSTAYSLSAGGSILAPDSGVFQITPVAAMSLNSRSVVVSDRSKIEVRVHQKRGVVYNLVADGQVVYDFIGDGKNDTTLVFHKSDNLVRLCHGDNWNFFSVLQEKLHWNQLV